VYAASAGKAFDMRDFTRKGFRPAPGEYVLIFSDTDETCEFCKLDYDLWLARGKRLPVEDFAPVWTAPDGNARLFRVR
jgi:hypothetical protein